MKNWTKVKILEFGSLSHRVLVKVSDDLRPKLWTSWESHLCASRTPAIELGGVEVVIKEQT